MPKTKVKDFTLLDDSAADLYIDKNDWEGAAIALAALQGDINLVGGRKPRIVNNAAELSDAAVLVGTIGKSVVIDRLIVDKKIDVSNIAGKWESYLLTVVENPAAGVNRALVVAGSDKRGSIYGIYKISEMIGVSPWVWWADSVPERKDKLTFDSNLHIEQGEPSVKYRGIFLNDEAPCLSGWVSKKFGKIKNKEGSHGYTSEFYKKVFELLLRLKGNYLWPTMWNNSFHTDDPLNTAMADTYGIVMGTSHQEHMTCADKEWSWAKLGAWNYAANKDAIYKFWENGVASRKDSESIITLGMRGQADTAILGPNATLKDNMNLIAEVLADQRKIINDVYGSADARPQLLALYKEVEDFYYGSAEHGKLDVPDDVTLMLCDDNFGNLRTLPTEEMRRRSGGFGMYYHFDYRGGPISYQWINQTPLTKIWEQMTTAFDAGVDRIWIVNVGDLKPMEFPIDYFLNLAYDYEKWSPANKVDEFAYRFAEREFGEKFAAYIVGVLQGYTKILGARKAEVVSAETFSLYTFDESARVLDDFEEIVETAETVFEELPANKKDTFFQLALYPARAAMNVYKCNIYAALSVWLAERNIPAANEYADLAQEAFEAEAADTETYNKKISGGKWDGIMRQNHYGYTAWDGPSNSVVANIMPKTGRVKSTAQIKTYIDTRGYVSINPARFSNNFACGAHKWTVIDDYGRDGDSIKVLPNGKIFPVDTGNAQQTTSPYVEYSFYLQTSGAYNVNIFIAPSNNRVHQTVTPILEQLRFSAQIDNGERKTASGMLDQKFAPGTENKTWAYGVECNTRLVTIAHGELSCGLHTLRIYAVDPDVVIQKIVIAPESAVQTDVSNAPQTYHFMGSYFGPPESLCV